MPIPLDYASPPPRILNRTPWLVVLSRWFAGLSVVMYLLLMFWEPGFQSSLRETDSDRWAGNELLRRGIERDRRNGILVAPGPPIPTPVAAGPGVTASMMLARAVALAWAIWFATALSRRGAELPKVRPVVHTHCIYKLAAVAPLMVLCVAAYARPFLEAGVPSPLWVVAAECASIAVAWYLLLKLPPADL